MTRIRTTLGLTAFALIGTVVAGCAGKEMSAPVTLKIGETTSAQAESYFGQGRVTKTMQGGKPVKIEQYALYVKGDNVVPGKDFLTVQTESENVLSQMGSGQMRLSLLLSFTEDKLTVIQASVTPLGRSGGTPAVYTIPNPSSY